MNKKMSDFTGLYPVSYTLKFELRPVGKTAETLKDSGLLLKDSQRADAYPKVKTFLDEQHKMFLQKVLAGITDINWQLLAEKIEMLRHNEIQKSDLEKIQTDYRKKITDKFSKDELYAILVKESTPSKLFKQLLKDSSTATEDVKNFASFACYFKGYQENRKNIYSDKPQQTSAAYRAVNENFTRFFDAVNIFSEFQTKFPDLIEDINSRTLLLCAGENLVDLLQISSYNKFLAQSGIDFINNIIGEINYAVNQYRQQHKEIKSAQLPFISVLYKQILSDRESAFAINSFENDSEVYDALKTFIKNNQDAEINGNHVDLFTSLQKELNNLTDTSDLFIDAKSLEKISSKITGSWDTILEAMKSFASTTIKGKSEQEKYCNRPVFNLQEIKSWNVYQKQEDDSIQAVNITTYWSGEYATRLFEIEKKLLQQLESLLNKDCKNLREDKKQVQIIKDYLDAVQEIFHLIKPLAVGTEYGGDLGLQSIFATYSEKLETIIPLYNQIRNYVTKKITDTAKIKLMFNKPTLADGWDANKEKANLTVILRKNNQFFLGIIAPESKIDWEDYITTDTTNCNYQKMVYKLLPGPNKMLPKVFFSDKNIDFYAPDADLLRRYKHGDHLKGEKFDLNFCHELIDFFKSSISKHEDWSKFGFQFSPTQSYKGIDEFYREVTEQGYVLKFVNIPEQAINSLIDEGKLFLFQIWNKDFSEKSTGTPNKATLYWRELFSPENLADVIFKLNGEAELFMRKQAIERKTAHTAGSKLVNRTIVTGVVKETGKTDRAVRQPIPENIHDEIFRYINDFKIDLSPETAAHLNKYPILRWQKGMPITDAVNKTVVKEAAFDLVKDKRFSEDKYLFHVPITVNFKAPGIPKFNDQVLEYLKDNPDVNIIGLDRGERNLIYLVLIDQQGQILEQKSLNLINGIDYHNKLDQREKARDAARKSWQEIGQIKDLKAGYLSGAIYEIARMMVEKNAIVVMEDLNFGFKRGRMKIEKQIYQKFEQALIDKLNYLVFKNESNRKAPGGVLNGYQLANKFESFAKLGKQCGFIFYVPAGFTSKIDPATGFVDIFNTRDCTSAEAIKAFFDKFDSIYYCADKNAFAFEFDYSKFKTSKTDYQNRWTVYSLNEAWKQEKDKSSGKYSAVLHNPTAEIKTAITDLGLKIQDGFDLLDLIRCIKAEKTTASFFKAVFYAFKHSTALRHSSQEFDKIISPVRDNKGEFFVSQFAENNTLPQDADANGAFHIALKGLYLLTHDIKNGKMEKLTHEKWIKFAQTRNK